MNQLRDYNDATLTDLYGRIESLKLDLININAEMKLIQRYLLDKYNLDIRKHLDRYDEPHQI